MAFSLRISIKSLTKVNLMGKYVQTVGISNYERSMIGRREIVGYGYNGQPWYVDRSDFPFPALRWKEPTPEIDALREKEKGDWNDLTCEEKKTLYRASFCQTFEEMHATNTGQWKSILATMIFLSTCSIWIFIFFKMTIYKATPLPASFSKESREHQFRRYIDLKANPIQGLASKWDYENDCWK